MCTIRYFEGADNEFYPQTGSCNIRINLLVTNELRTHECWQTHKCQTFVSRPSRENEKAPRQKLYSPKIETCSKEK